MQKDKGYGGYFKEVTGGISESEARANPQQDIESISLTDMDGRYSILRPANKPMTRLHVVERNGKVRSYQYVNLCSGSTFTVTQESHVFTLDFMIADGKLERITVRGRSLWRLYDYVALHRWAYLRAIEENRDFAQDKEPVITSISIDAVREDEGN